jgi:hypothetical protein
LLVVGFWQDKKKLCDRSGSQGAKDWLKAHAARLHNEKDSAQVMLENTVQALLEENNVVATESRQRQTVLDKRTVDVVGTDEIPILHYFLSRMFYACRIPFMVVDNCFFKDFIEALRPAYSKHLPSSSTLRGNFLDKIFEDCIRSTDAALLAVDGKRTLGLDGKTDVRGRSTVNFTDMKQVI